MINTIENHFNFIESHESSSLNETSLIGLNFSKTLKVGQLIGFVGELGAGKTELIRAICAGLGDNSLVSSPTYALENQYLLPKGQSVAHWDLYRIQADIGEIYSEIRDEKNLGKTLIFVEWPMPIVDLLDMLVLISCNESGTRKISKYAKK